MLHFDFNFKTAKGARTNRIDPDTDEAGDLNLPKSLRRQICYEVRKNAVDTVGSFVEYLKIRRISAFTQANSCKKKIPMLRISTKSEKVTGSRINLTVQPMVYHDHVL